MRGAFPSLSPFFLRSQQQTLMVVVVRLLICDTMTSCWLISTLASIVVMVVVPVLVPAMTGSSRVRVREWFSALSPPQRPLERLLLLVLLTTIDVPHLLLRLLTPPNLGRSVVVFFIWGNFLLSSEVRFVNPQSPLSVTWRVSVHF